MTIKEDLISFDDADFDALSESAKLALTRYINGGVSIATYVANLVNADFSIAFKAKLQSDVDTLKPLFEKIATASDEVKQQISDLVGIQAAAEIVVVEEVKL